MCTKFRVKSMSYELHYELGTYFQLSKVLIMLLWKAAVLSCLACLSIKGSIQEPCLVMKTKAIPVCLYLPTGSAQCGTEVLVG